MTDLSLVLNSSCPLKIARRGYLPLPLVNEKESCFVAISEVLVEAAHGGPAEGARDIYFPSTHADTYKCIPPLRTKVGVERSHFFLSYPFIHHQK